MQLRNKGELLLVPVGSHLYLINSFSKTDQALVRVDTLKITKVNVDHFRDTYDIPYYFSDMLRECKYVFTEEAEALARLAIVRGGLHASTVAKHRADCERLCGLNDE